MPTKLRLRATIALVCGAFAATGLTGLAGPSSATPGVPVPAASAGHLTSWGAPGLGNSIPGSLANDSFVAVDSSPYTNYNLAIRTDGTVAAWGDPAAPTTLPQGLDHVIAVAAGPTYALALKDDGTITPWGDPSAGTLAIPFKLTRGGVTAIAATFSTALAVQDGQVTVWGTGAPAPPPIDHVVQVAAGDDYYLALRSDHTVVAWGTDTGGDTYVPAAIQGHVVQIAAGGLTSAALLDNGTVRVWGNGMPMPTPPAGLSGEKVNEIDVSYSIVARTASGKVFTWGRSLPAVKTMSDLGGYPVAIAGGGGDYTVAILGKAATTTRITAPAGAWGRPHKITATVTADGGPGTGTVTIKAGPTTTTATLNSSGVATVTLPAQLRVGRYAVTASYAGNDRATTSTGSGTLSITKAGVKLSEKFPAVIKHNKRVTAAVTAKITGSSIAATGTVKIYKGKKVVGSAKLVRGVAKVKLAKLPKGTQKLVIKLPGNANVNAAMLRFRVKVK